MQQFVQISDELKIRYISIGQGQPIIFIPGWTMTADAFNRSLKPFSERFQAISYDPRSHGRSTILKSGNDYAQHGRDLAAFIGELGLKDVVLVGWSSGALAAYAYFQQFGYGNARAFVSIDMSPKPLMESESDWGIDTRENIRLMLASATAPDHSFMVNTFASQIYRSDPADEIYIQGMIQQSLNMDPHIAALLLADVNLCDYTEVASTTAAKLPVLHVVRQQALAAARKWMDANAPDAELYALGGHMMFWEHAERFNRVVARFLDAKLHAQRGAGN